MGHSLYWSVLCSLVIVKPVSENGRALSHDNRSLFRPVGPSHHADFVVLEALNGLLRECLEVLLVRCSAGSQHNGDADVVVIPIRNGAHTS